MAQKDFEAPIMPTGSGVADLEIAREQDALAADGALTGAVEDESDVAETIVPPEQPPMDDAAGGPGADADVDLPGVTASGAE